MNQRFADCLNDLIGKLEEVPAHQIRGVVASWARDNFSEFNVRATINERDLEYANGSVDIKTHYVRRAIIDASLEIASQTAIGAESAVKGYVPAFMPASHFAMPYRELDISFTCLLRQPLSRECPMQPVEWLEKVVGDK